METSIQGFKSTSCAKACTEFYLFNMYNAKSEKKYAIF
jgi:hypothetical protein